jgi:hypothetical protein
VAVVGGMGRAFVGGADVDDVRVWRAFRGWLWQFGQWLWQFDSGCGSGDLTVAVAGWLFDSGRLTVDGWQWRNCSGWD